MIRSAVLTKTSINSACSETGLMYHNVVTMDCHSKDLQQLADKVRNEVSALNRMLYTQTQKIPDMVRLRNVLGQVETVSTALQGTPTRNVPPATSAMGYPACPAGFPLETLDAFDAFSKEDDPRRYEEFVQWLFHHCDGVDVTSVINCMMKETIAGDLAQHLYWSKNLNKSKYAKACRAAMNLMIQQGRFTNSSALAGGDGKFAAAIQGGLRSAKARLSRQKKST